MIYIHLSTSHWKKMAQNTFNQSKKLLKIFDVVGGTHIFRSNETNLTFFQKITRLYGILSIGSFLFMLIYTTFWVRPDPFLMIIGGCAVIIIITASDIYYILVVKRDVLLKVVDWCESVQKRKGAHFEQARIRCLKYVKMVSGYSYFLGFNTTLVTILLGLIFSHKLIPPLPFWFPFNDPTSFLARFVTAIVQFSGIFIYDSSANALYGIMAIHYPCFLAYMDDIILKLKELKYRINDSQLNGGTKKPQNVQNEIQNQEINFSESLKNIIIEYSDGIE